MVPFIIRRVLQSVMVIIVASLVLHTVILVVLPDKFMNDFRQLQGQGNQFRGPEHPPWPIGYLTWLFDPNKTTKTNENFEEVPTGLDWTIGGWHIRGSGALTGEFGTSSVGQGLPVTEVIASRWGNTAALVIAALIPTLFVSIALGVFAASRQRSRVDHALTVVSFVGLSLPPYWIGLMLVLFLAVISKNLHDVNGWTWLPYFPPGDVKTAGTEGSFTDRLYHLVLPATALALGLIAAMSRQVRFAMLEVLGKDYVRTAWAKGLPPRRVFYRHAFRNAMIPLITTFTLALPTLVAGTIVIEAVFGYSGMGQLFFRAVGGQTGAVILRAGSADYYLLMVLMLIMVIVVVFSNLLADVLYVIFNPRMSVR